MTEKLKMFRMLIDKGEDYQKVLDTFRDTELYCGSQGYIQRSYGDIVNEIMEENQRVMEREDLSREAKACYIAERMYHVAKLYATFFEEISEEYEGLVDKFFDEEGYKREVIH
jgi:hypothetical protein